MNSHSVLIADDHPIFRHGLKSVLNEMDDIDVVGEADNGESALTQLEYLRPELALLDLAMPGRDGLSVLEQVYEHHPEVKVIIITSYDDKAYLDRAFDLGARGYLLKDTASDDLVNCLESVLSGDTFISPTLGSQTPVEPIMSDISQEKLESLTPTERTVLLEIAQFKTSKEIARELGISFRTVQNHRSHISEKLDLKGTHQLLRFVRENMSAIEALGNHD